MDNLTREDLRKLLEVNDDLSVSIYMPVQRTGDIQQNPIRLKNLVNQAQEKLVAAGARPAIARDLLKPIQNRLEDTLFWQGRRDGLALFISQNSFWSAHLPFPFAELVAVGQRLVIKPLLPVLSGDTYFYVLSLSQNAVKLLRCTELGAEEIDLTGITPLSRADATGVEEYERNSQHSSPGAGQASIRFQKSSPADSSKKEILRFFQEVDHGLQTILKDETNPLVFAGVEYLFPIYLQANTYSNLLPQIISGNSEGLNNDRLREQGWKIVLPFIQKTRDAALAKYNEIAGKGYTSTNISNIVPAAYYGRVDTLFVALGPQIWGRINTDNGSVTLSQQAEPGNLDLLDFAAAYTLARRGSVFTLASDRLFDNSPVAAMLRY